MAYSETINELKKDLFKLHPENEKFYNLIEGLLSIERAKSTMTYTINSPKPKLIKLVFDRNSPATEQVLFALRYLNTVGKASTIINAIKEFDSSFDKQMSTPFYKLKMDGQIKIYNPSITAENPEGSNHQVYYGLAEWFEAENKVKDEYLTDDLKQLE